MSSFPVSPRSFPPAPGCSPDGHRIKAPLEYRALRPGQGVGVRRSQSKGRQVAELHFPLPELQRLHKAASEDRAGHPQRSYLLDRKLLKRFVKKKDDKRLSSIDADIIIWGAMECADKVVEGEVDPEELLGRVSVPGLPDSDSWEGYESWT